MQAGSSRTSTRLEPDVYLAWCWSLYELLCRPVAFRCDSNSSNRTVLRDSAASGGAGSASSQLASRDRRNTEIAISSGPKAPVRSEENSPLQLRGRSRLGSPAKALGEAIELAAMGRHPNSARTFAGIWIRCRSRRDPEISLIESGSMCAAIASVSRRPRFLRCCFRQAFAILQSIELRRIARERDRARQDHRIYDRDVQSFKPG